MKRNDYITPRIKVHVMTENLMLDTSGSGSDNPQLMPGLDLEDDDYTPELPELGQSDLWKEDEEDEE